jgi:hypothetical protein
MGGLRMYRNKQMWDALDERQEARPQGRLVMVTEEQPGPASQAALRKVLSELMATPEVTMVAGLHQAGMMRARASTGEAWQIIYNTADPLPLSTACSLLPWREVWLISAGRVWRAGMLAS